MVVIHILSKINCAGETPLIHAARQGRLETVEYLLGRGADPSVASNMGATALHHAAGIGNDDAVPNGCALCVVDYCQMMLIDNSVC